MRHGFGHPLSFRTRYLSCISDTEGVETPLKSDFNHHSLCAGILEFKSLWMFIVCFPVAAFSRFLHCRVVLLQVSGQVSALRRVLKSTEE